MELQSLVTIFQALETQGIKFVSKVASDLFAKWGMDGDSESQKTDLVNKANAEGQAVVTKDMVDTYEVSLTYDTILGKIFSNIILKCRPNYI